VILWMVGLMAEVTGASSGEHWAEALLVEGRVRSLIRGYPDGSIRPDRPISRAEFAALVVRSIVGEEGISERKRLVSRFVDVSLDHWAKPYLDLLGEVGVLQGNELGEVRPDHYISRAEAVTMMDRMLVSSGVTCGPGPIAFWDKDLIPDWAVPSVKRLVRLGIIKGDDKGCFRPDDNITRAEAVAVVLRSMEVLGKRWDLEGRIAGFDKETGEISVMTQGENVTLKASLKSIYIVKEGSIVEESSLRTGNHIKIVFKGNTRRIGLIKIET